MDAQTENTTRVPVSLQCNAVADKLEASGSGFWMGLPKP